MGNTAALARGNSHDSVHFEVFHLHARYIFLPGPAHVNLVTWSVAAQPINTTCTISTGTRAQDRHGFQGETQNNCRWSSRGSLVIYSWLVNILCLFCPVYRKHFIFFPSSSSSSSFSSSSSSSLSFLSFSCSYFLPQSGKTALSNILAEATGGVTEDYHPTQGVRILEFEVTGEAPNTTKLLRVEIELWDCGGNRQWEWYY